MSDDEKDKELEELAEIINDDETDSDEEDVEEITEDEETAESEEIEDTEEVVEEKLEEEEKNTPVEETEDIKEKKKDKRKTAVIIVEVVVILMLIGLILYFFVFKDKEKKPVEITEPTTKEIARPSSDLEYVPVKQSTFELACSKTKDGEKIKTLKKGMVIECTLEFETAQRVSELYFDLSASKNIKFSSYTNDSGYTIESDGKTYKLSTLEPLQKMEKGINFYYEVTDETEKTGYIEVKDVVFKDDNGKYYKAINGLTTFPVEYDDKIYIFKDDYEDETYYFARKTLKPSYSDCEDCEAEDDEDNSELIDTFQCEDETCDVVAHVSKYFLIYDKQLLVYDPLKKTTRKIKLDDDFDVKKYDYELTIGSNDNVMGVLFQKDYVDNYECGSNGCYDTGISGYKVGYYSFNSNTFTIALDYGWVGSPEYSEYDRVLLLQKDNKIGVFSYEDDEMALEASDEYTSASYDADLNAVVLELRDGGSSYYYKYFDLDTKSFKLNTKRLQKFEDANLFYTLKTNRLGFTLATLFNAKGENLKNLPYVNYAIIKSVDDRITTYADKYYTYYKLDGSFIYSSSFTEDKIIDHISVPETKGSINILDIDGKYAFETDIEKYNVICDNTDTNQYVSATLDVDNNKMEVYVKDSSVTDEGMNGYKYVITSDEQTDQIIVTPEVTFIK